MGYCWSLWHKYCEAVTKVDVVNSDASGVKNTKGRGIDAGDIATAGVSNVGSNDNIDPDIIDDAEIADTINDDVNPDAMNDDNGDTGFRNDCSREMGFVVDHFDRSNAD